MSLELIIVSGVKFTGVIIFFGWVRNKANQFFLRQLLLSIDFETRFPKCSEGVLISIPILLKFPGIAIRINTA